MDGLPECVRGVIIMIDDQTRVHPSSTGAYYRIKVRGVLDPHWSARFGGLCISNADGDTTISGYIIDQAALHGLLMQIRDLGLPLLLVQQIETISKP